MASVVTGGQRFFQMWKSFPYETLVRNGKLIGVCGQPANGSNELRQTKKRRAANSPLDSNGLAVAGADHRPSVRVRVSHRAGKKPRPIRSISREATVAKLAGKAGKTRKAY